MCLDLDNPTSFIAFVFATLSYITYRFGNLCTVISHALHTWNEDAQH